MKVLILGTSGVHHPLIAANMIMGSFSYNLSTVDKYCDTRLDDSGFPIYVGTDEKGNQIYTLGVGKELATAKKALSGLMQVFDGGHNQVLITEITIKGEAGIRLAARLNRLPLGNQLNKLISSRILGSQFHLIESQVKELSRAMDWAAQKARQWGI